ncbi:DUF6345 domain-containing protein [Micromonospora sp. NPDC006766]|uniref:DUF6345 domain-containing protein n=1 Tax=Micromonospora sp. NPDC006766 TaxID=3154778 RepID=UPI0034024B98
MTIAVAGAPVVAAEIRELPVYRVSATGLDEAQTEALRKAFGIEQLTRTKEGSVGFADEQGFLHIPSIELGAAGKDEDGNETVASVVDEAALAKLKPVSKDEALSLTQKALTAADLYPKQGEAIASHTTLEMVDAKGRSTVSAALDTTVSFAFTLGGLPYEGPGAKVRVAFSPDGKVTQLSYNTRSLKAEGSVAVLDLKAGRERCAEAMGGAVRIETAAYAYHAPALDTKLERLEPSFSCSGVTADGTPAQIVFVPAAVDAKLPGPVPSPVPPRPQAAPATGAGLGTQAYGRVDVGSEGTGPCSGLPWTGKNLASFNNQFSSHGIPVEFSWLDQNAWERDFKDPVYRGNDSAWTDHVDMTYWQGHGSPTGFSFSGCSSSDDTFLANTEARWGNGDAEWMSLFTCLVLAKESGGKQWWQRWGGAFDGLHQINSFHTVSYHSASHGGTFANYLLRKPFLWWNNPMPVRKAWAQASIDDQPASVVWATMGPTGPRGLVNFDDYFWGKGSVGPDVPASSRTGWWYISGTS